MITRVTSSAVNNTLTTQINNRYADYAKLTQQMTTGDRVNSIMDDPIEAINIVNSTRHLNRIGIWVANVDSLNNEIKQTSETIDKMISKGQRAKDLAATAANGTSAKTTLEATMTELNQLIRGMVDMANTNYNGNYIYAGANTKTPPYEIQYAIDAEGNTTDEIIGVKYTGTPIDGDWQRQLEVSDGIFKRMNVTGIEAFGNYDIEPVYEDEEKTTLVLDDDGNPTYEINSESGIFADVINFKNKLQELIDKYTEQEQMDENTPQSEKERIGAEIKSCYDDISGMLDGFTQSINKMTTVNETFGALTNQLTMTQDSLGDNELNLQQYIAGIKELDITKAVSDWYKTQYAYQASMQASTSIMSMSLLNYL